MIRAIFAGIILGSLTASGAGGAAAAGTFKAGYNRIDVTPPLGTPMSGYYHRRLADGVLDPLHARCLALSDGESRALVYSVDNLQIPDAVTADIKAEITRKTGVPAEAIFIACTHTHTGPSTALSGSVSTLPEDEDTIRFSNRILAARCADAGVRALEDLAPAKLLLGRGEAKNISFIRRFRMKDGTTRTNPGTNNPEVECALGEPDEQVQLVRFVRDGKKEIALINFQCHPDVISGTKFSADWPGLASTYLERAMDNEIEALLINGAQGDTNHLRPKTAPGEIVPRRYEMSKHMARTIVGAALSAWGTCAPAPAGKVRAAMPAVKVLTNKGKPEEIPLAEKYVNLHKTGRAKEIPGVGMEHTANTAAAYRILELKDAPAETELRVSVVTVGQTLAFGGFPGEPFTWMGTELKDKSPFTMTIPACTVNGSRGYFPVKSAYGPGGYENATSRFKAGVAERLVEGTLQQMAEFHKAATSNEAGSVKE
jgi:neutral ceramidase